MNEFTWKATGYSLLAFMILMAVASTFVVYTSGNLGIKNLSVVFLSCDYIGTLLCILMFYILVNDALRDRGAFLFTMMVVVLFALQFVSLMEIVFQAGGYHLYELAMEYLSTFLSMLLVVTLFYYIWYATDRRGTVLNIFRHTMNIIFVASVIFLLLNHIFHHLFYINDAGNMVYPYGYIGPYLMSFVMGCVIFATILLYVDGIRKKVALGTYISLPFGALVLGYFIGGAGFINIAYLMAIFVDYSNVYVKRRQLLVNKDAKLLQQRADILISQIQPHFLYNALTSIMNIKGNPMETRDAIADFGKYLRGNLDTLKQKGPIPIRMEMDHVETFSELVKLNSGEDLSVNVEFNDRNFLIPSLTVQSVLEYVIEFGFGIEHMEGRIDLNIFESEDAHVVLISDDRGLVRKCFDISKGSMATLGLSAVEVRLRDMVGGTLAFNSLADDIVVTISVPKKEARNSEITASA